MKIEIDYNGAYAVCKVDGKHITQCDALTRGQALSAFSCIEQHLRRGAQAKREERECVDYVRCVNVPVERRDDGNYYITYNNRKQEYQVFGYGKTLKEAKEDFYAAFNKVRKYMIYTGQSFEELCFDFVVEEPV